jgi:serine/threonine protein kinase
VFSRERPCGTPAYQAPEVQVGRKTPQKYSDVYSAALVITEWFSGSRAWTVEEEDDDIGDAAKRKKKANVMPDGLVNVPDRVRPLLTECLSYSRSERPTAEVMRERLEKLAGNVTCVFCII